MKVVHSRHHAPVGWLQGLSERQIPAGICQSAFWGEIKNQLDEDIPNYLEVYEGQRKCLSLLFLEQRSRPSRRLLGKVTNRLFGRQLVLDWHDGPVFHTEEATEISAAYETALGWIDYYAKDHRAARIRGSFPHSFSKQASVAVSQVAKDFGYRVSTWATLLVDLNVDEQTLWANLKPSARKAVRKAEKLRLSVALAENEEDLDSFLRAYKEFETSFGRHPSPAARTKNLWRLDQKEHYRFFLAKNGDGQILGVLGMHVFNRVATEIASSLSPVALESGVPAQDLLHWTTLLVAKELGCHTFDLAGVHPNPKTKKELGILRFKQKWGGLYTEYPIHRKQFGFALNNR